MIVPRCFYATIYYSRYVYVFGGFLEQSLENCEVYSLERNTWDELPLLPSPSRFNVAALIEHKIYVTGS